MKVVWSPEARQDLREIYSYLAAENPYAARTLQQRLKQAVQLLRENPHIGRPGRVADTRELVISGTSYIVPYQIKEKRLELLRVYHMARKWPERFH
ncbi:MAG: type II toxin-antitoxin system RelE/ParE family toxin [Pseudomonadota bacterium]|nr:type II toxin-antitoxin system RelE/ParE family toxin [Pseudomonadota bacterium]